MVTKYCFSYLWRKILRKHIDLIVLIILFSSLYLVLFLLKPYSNVFDNNIEDSSSKLIKFVWKVVPANASLSKKGIKNCTYYSCFNPFNCGQNGKQMIQVYIYPLNNYVDEDERPIIRRLTKEFYSILLAIKRSKYYTPFAENACIFIPPFDTLSSYNFELAKLSQALNLLPFWKDGENHILFNFLPAKDLDLLSATGLAIIAGSGFDSWTYRPSFDISIPPFTPAKSNIILDLERKWFIAVTQLNLHPTFLEKLREASRKFDDIVIFEKCSPSNLLIRCFNNEQYSYNEILAKSVFCVVVRGSHLIQPLLIEAIASGCIPIIVSDSLIMPFHEIIDWKRAAVFVLEENIQRLVESAKLISRIRIKEMSKQAQWLYQRYFSSVEVITIWTLEILNQRVFPENAFFYEDWNLRDEFIGARSPIFRETKSSSPNFTAVILAYDRIDSLFFIIERLNLVRSLSAILVVWNNQNKAPPLIDEFPIVSKSITVIHTKSNRLSNRFLPFKEIQTECVLSMDDDISMLTADELDFGFEVWKEFPDRIVGFPSRTHVWSNETSTWRYESEWTNEISMILTGAAFYHKYWHYMYTKKMPANIRRWVDRRMNCEDIAMNFLVANVTNKPVIKVGPRKKFKCPECVNTQMLSVDSDYMKERNRCINKFIEFFGRMPLKHVEFRADPVLYKCNVPEKFKSYHDIGSL